MTQPTGQMPTAEQQQPDTTSVFAAPQISLPKGGGAIRGLGEKFQTNPANGTGTLSFPIALSKTRAGFQPALTLSYSSGLGNGPFGLGWTIGMPSISRRTDKGVPRYLPFARSARDVAAADASADIFLMSGSEDLVPIAADDGPWVAHRVTNGYFVRGYRPRIEGTFARIESWTRMTDGDTHWRTISRDNILTVYGEGPESRIADPDNPQRVFTWLICRSYDDRGNAIEYEYTAEGDDGVNTSQASERFRTRTANRYPKRVRYGNRLPQLLDLSTDSARSCHLPPPDVDPATAWLFEIVFDYGDEAFVHVPEADGFERVSWSDFRLRSRLSRLDPFSVSRGGFEIRTYRLCRRILITHRMPEKLGEPRTLVRGVHLDYDEKPNGTRLAHVTQSAYLSLGNGFYRRRSLPSVLLHYSSSPLDDPAPCSWAVQDLPQESLENLPVGIAGHGYQWMDLDGEGISGVLTAQAGAWLYKPNRGNGRFGPSQAVRNTPPVEGGRLQLMDVDADGRLEFAALAAGTGGFFDRTADAGWTPFRPFRSLPNLDFTDPHLRLADLSGDGLADILITDDHALTWHQSLGDCGFGEAIRVRVPWNDENGPRVLLGQSDQSVFLADMSGDGLADLVRIRNGEVCYWQNFGHGRFGPKITIGSPWFDEDGIFDARRLRLADTDGSGPTDILYAGRDGVKVFLNESGNALSAPRLIPEMALTDGVSLDVVDLLGRGTACLVSSTALPGLAWRPVRYIDLMCGEKPHLLVRWENQLGAETRLTYASSTEFYLEDRDAGRPWPTRLPFPVHVIKTIETIDHVSKNHFISSYRYHHGHYDGVEREFRGFGMVEQIDSEYIGALAKAANWDPTLRLPPVLTKTWFHTGHYDEERRVSHHFVKEYYRESSHTLLLPDTIVPAGLTFEETREACRALKGSALRQEVYALDDSPESSHPYYVTESNFSIRLLQSRRSGRYAIFDSHARESVTLQYERKLYDVEGRLRPDPRVTHHVTLRIDGFGNVLESATTAYGRRYRSSDLSGEDQERQGQTLVTFTENSFTNAVSLPDAFRVPLVSESRTWELGGVAPVAHRRHATNLFEFDELRERVAVAREPGHEVPFADWHGQSRPTSGPYCRLLDLHRTRYRANRLDRLLAKSKLESMALPGERDTLVFQAGLIEQLLSNQAQDALRALCESGGYVDLDGDGNLWRPSGRVFYSADDGLADAELDDAMANFFLPMRVRDPFGEDTRTEFDCYRLLVLSVTDALRNHNTFEYNYRLLAPFLSTDLNGNRTEVAFDTLGMVVGTAVMGKSGEYVGDSLDNFAADLDPAMVAAYFNNPFDIAPEVLGRASTRDLYDLDAFSRNGGPSVAASLQREIHDADLRPAETVPIQHRLVYSDGFGREIQRKMQAEPGPVEAAHVDRRWIGTGWTVFNNKGKPVRQYEPFFSVTHQFEFSARHGVSPTLVYDPLERVIGTLKPNGTFTKTVYEPWLQEAWDENDTTLLNLRTDPDIGRFVERLPESSRSSWYDSRIHGAFGADERSAAEHAALHAATPAVLHFDSLGRMFVTIAHNRFERNGTVSEERLVNRVALDIQGAPRVMYDALGRTMMRLEYDLSGRQIYRRSADAGERWMLCDSAGKSLVMYDGQARRVRTTYDALRRQTAIYVRDSDGTERLTEHTFYGETIPDALARNLRGKPVRIFDAAGVVTNEAYDFKGNLLSAARQLATEFREELDWRDEPLLEPERFRGQTSYDALNRPRSLTTPDGSVIWPSYNEANLLSRVELDFKGRGAPETIVAEIIYTAKGQRENVRYGNGCSARHEYDPLTFRLVHTFTTRSSDGFVLQDLSYTFDPVGNITNVCNAAARTVFFDNHAVDASASYQYDALYRLISATGREHAHIGDRLAAGEFNVPALTMPLSSDKQALRRYSEQFTYDPVGNLLELLHAAGAIRWRRIHKYGSIGENNRLTESSQGSHFERFDYDVHGNLLTMPHLPEMGWNFKDQLRFTRHQFRAQRAGATTYYVYDAGGQRVRKVVTSENGCVLRDRIYLGPFELERRIRRGKASVKCDSVHVMDGASRLALVESREGTRTTRFQFSDHLGNVVLELDGRASILTREEYYAFGETSFADKPSAPGCGRKRYRFTGKERDDETGFSYHGARYYIPWLARWSATDPAGIVDGANLYVYGRNNPIMMTDPTGRSCDPTMQSCADPTEPTPREEALQQSLPEDERYLPPASKTQTNDEPPPTPCPPAQWELGPRGEHIPTDAWTGGPLRPADSYTKPYAQMYAARGNYEAAELAENYLCATCHVLTRVDPDKFSIRGYTRGWQRAYIQGFVEVPLQATPVGAAWSIGVSGTEAFTGETSGLQISNISSVLVDKHWDVGRQMSGGEQTVRGVQFVIGVVTLGLAARASGTPPSNPFANLADEEIDAAIGTMSSRHIFRGPASATESGFAPETMVPVSRWGRPGLQPEDWVMNGPPTYSNYVRSFKWDPNPTNIRAPYTVGEGYIVPPVHVTRPTGWGLDGWWKSLFGQRKYTP